MVERMWMVRAGEYSRLIDDFRKKGIIAIGWDKLGDLSNYKSPSQIKEAVLKLYSELGKNHNYSSAGQISKFLFELKKDDYVISYDSNNRVYLIGKIISDYEYKKGLCEYNNIRYIKILGEISRDSISVSTKNTLGAILALFEIVEPAKTELINLLNNKKVTNTTEVLNEEILEDIKEDFVSKAHEFIKDKILNLSWEQMQDLAAGILRSMDYKTRVSPSGPDKGKDVVASKDGLGLEGPKIIVEVKHRNGQMGSKEVRSFISVLRENQKGIFISTGGFSSNAELEAERAERSITLVNLDYLVDLVIQNYDNFDVDSKLLIPLVKIYWPN